MTVSRTLFIATLASVAALSGAPSSHAAEVTSVFPRNGSEGETVSLLGTGFGEKKGKVALLPDAGRGKHKIKLLGWSDGHITVRLKKAAPGPATFTIRPKGGESLTASYTVDEPQFAHNGVGPDPAPRGSIAAVGVRGSGGRVKVTVGGVRVKIKRLFKESGNYWAFTVPGSLADGEHAVVVASRYGTITTKPGEGLMVMGDDQGLGNPFVEFTLTDLDLAGRLLPETEKTIRVARKNLKAKVDNWRESTFLDVKIPGGPTIELRVGLRYGTYAPVGYVATYGQYTGDWIVYREIGSNTQTEWGSDRGSSTDHRMVLTETGAGQLSATFEATIVRRSGTGTSILRRIEGTFLVNTKPHVR